MGEKVCIECLVGRTIYIYGAGDTGIRTAIFLAGQKCLSVRAIIVSDGHKLISECRLDDGRSIEVLEVSELGLSDAQGAMFINTVVAGRDAVDAEIRKRFPGAEILSGGLDELLRSMYDDIVERITALGELLIYDELFEHKKIAAHLIDIGIPVKGSIVGDGRKEYDSFFSPGGCRVDIYETWEICDGIIPHPFSILELDCEAKALLADMSDDRHMRLTKSECVELTRAFNEGFLIKAGADEHLLHSNLQGDRAFEFSIRPAVFPPGCEEVSIDSVSRSDMFPEGGTAIVFAGYCEDGRIQEDDLRYLRALKDESDLLVINADSPLMPGEIEKVCGIADIAHFGHHGEYDFGSYKRGYKTLKERGILNKASHLFLCNDSVVWTGRSLRDLFNRSKQYDACGMIVSSGLGSASEKKVDISGYVFYEAPKERFMGSFFLSLSKRVFAEGWFDSFMMRIRAEHTKADIIRKYELGLSRSISRHGIELHSYYPCDRPERSMSDYLSPRNKEALFVKKFFANQRFL